MEIKYEEPQPVNANKAEINEFAEEVARKHKYSPGADINSLVENTFGGTIKYDHLKRFESGRIQVNGLRNFVIILPIYASDFRNRFTIAHELGHYILHSCWGAKPIQASRFGSDLVEWQANWFSAGFLMPAKEIKADYEETRDLFYLASKYRVSVDAMNVRCRILGLLS